MYISKLIVKNFKSIASADISFDPLTMLVGANASGKSNLINVFRFISNIMTDGIDNAIALQGGIQYLANASLPKGTPIEISFTLNLAKEGWIRFPENKTKAMEVNELKYHFIIQPNLKGGGYHILSDDLALIFDCLLINPDVKGKEKYTKSGIQYTLIAEKKSKNSLAK